MKFELDIKTGESRTIIGYDTTSFEATTQPSQKDAEQQDPRKEPDAKA